MPSSQLNKAKFELIYQINSNLNTLKLSQRKLKRLLSSLNKGTLHRLTNYLVDEIKFDKLFQILYQLEALSNKGQTISGRTHINLNAKKITITFALPRHR